LGISGTSLDISSSALDIIGTSLDIGSINVGSLIDSTISVGESVVVGSIGIGVLGSLTGQVEWRVGSVDFLDSLFRHDMYDLWINLMWGNKF
jgi:hypothetical protein